mmetsp:Transcript_1118/g.2383  ORF Transcript_1118/g.2383 Transcript_1118/m.2383 type:complete len:280 (+) Transcript_1118:397-1236(+)
MERYTFTTTRSLNLPTRIILVLLLSIYTYFPCQSFQPSSSLFLTTRLSESNFGTSSTRNNRETRHSMNTRFFTDPSSPNVHDQTPPRPSFEQRMREQLRRNQSSTSPAAPKESARSKLVPDVRTLQDFKEILDDTGENDKMMAVLWYSPWCKACKAVIPGIRTLAKRHPDVQFIQVPVLGENANLHQGLDVPSVPFLHLYTPEDPRLVEELKMTRKRLSGFQKLLMDYERGSCTLEHEVKEGEDHQHTELVWSTASPYSSPPNRDGGTETTSGAATKVE